MAIKTSLTTSEIKQMLEKASCLRDKVILAFYADTGCRVSEFLRVKVEHLDLDNGLVLIPHLKRGIKKRCPHCDKSAGRSTAFCSHCGTDLSKVVAEGIEERNRLIDIGDLTVDLLREYTEKMATSDNIINITRQQVYNIVRELALSIGIKGKAILNPETGKHHFVHPHNFRDSLAVDWLKVRGDMEGQKALQLHLGHKNFETTARYNKLTLDTVSGISEEVRQRRFLSDEAQAPHDKSDTKNV